MKRAKYLPCLILGLMYFSGFAQINELESSIDNYLSPLIKGNNFSVAILISENNEIIISKGYGKANSSFEVENSPIESQLISF